MVQKKIFGGKDFSEGIARVITLMPELAMDFPKIHTYLFKYVILPLLERDILKLESIKWNEVIKKDEPDDDDDIVFDNTDPQFKLLAHIL